MTMDELTKDVYAFSEKLADRDGLEWGSRYKHAFHQPLYPPLPRPPRRLLHYPASESRRSGKDKSRLGFRVQGFGSSPHLPAPSHQSSAPAQQKNDRSRNVVWNHPRDEYPSSRASAFRLSARPPRSTSSRPRQRAVKNTATSTNALNARSHRPRQRKHTPHAGSDAIYISAARWRVNRTHGGRVVKKAAPRTCRLTMPPAPTNTTQKIMHHYNNAAKKHDDALGMHPLSSLASPRLDGTPVRLGSAAAIGHLLRGQIDTFGTLLLPRHRPESRGGSSGGAVVYHHCAAPPTFTAPPPLGPVTRALSSHDAADENDLDDLALNIDTFGSNLDVHAHHNYILRRSRECEVSYANQLPSNVFYRREDCAGSETGVEWTPLRRTISCFSDATNSTWLGEDEAGCEDDDGGRWRGACCERSCPASYSPSVPTSPVAWTPASPAPHLC